MDIRSVAVSFLLKVKPTWCSKVLLIQEENLNARHSGYDTRCKLKFYDVGCSSIENGTSIILVSNKNLAFEIIKFLNLKNVLRY